MTCLRQGSAGDEHFDDVNEINPILDNIIIVDGVEEGPMGEVLGMPQSNDKSCKL